jgi:hypothetical protein
MRHSLMRVALALTAVTIVGPVRAQVPAPVAAAPQYPVPPSLAALPPSGYPTAGFQPSAIQAPTPEDAYRDGTINRWEYERLVGPLPAAFQGPSVDGNRGGDGGSFDGGR